MNRTKTEARRLTAELRELLELAIRRNATHGLQLSLEDKRDMARRIYNGTPERDRDGKKAELASMLSISERSVRNWLSRIDKDAKEARDKRIFGLWLACHTQQQIADAIGCSRDDVRGVKELGFGESGKLSEFPQALQAEASHATNFTPPIYNVWKQQEKTPGASHFGNSEVRWVDNLLYLYTQPFDVVVDPFAGSGSTADLCRKRLRRYWVSDRLPVVGREDVIRSHDLTEGLPPLPRWQDVRLVYLDPPYWKQAEGQRRARATLAGRYAPWGFPWCAGPGSPYHQPPLCEGCAGRLALADQAAAFAPRVAELKVMLAPVPVQARLF